MLFSPESSYCLKTAATLLLTLFTSFLDRESPVWYSGSLLVYLALFASKAACGFSFCASISSYCEDMSDLKRFREAPWPPSGLNFYRVTSSDIDSCCFCQFRSNVFFFCFCCFLLLTNSLAPLPIYDMSHGGYLCCSSLAAISAAF